MRIELIFLLFSYIIADPFESWLENNKHIFDGEYKKVSFLVSIGSNILSNKIEKYITYKFAKNADCVRRSLPPESIH